MLLGKLSPWIQYLMLFRKTYSSDTKTRRVEMTRTILKGCYIKWLREIYVSNNMYISNNMNWKKTNHPPKGKYYTWLESCIESGTSMYLQHLKLLIGMFLHISSTDFMQLLSKSWQSRNIKGKKNSSSKYEQLLSTVI